MRLASMPPPVAHGPQGLALCGVGSKQLGRSLSRVAWVSCKDNTMDTLQVTYPDELHFSKYGFSGGWSGTFAPLGSEIEQVLQGLGSGAVIRVKGHAPHMREWADYTLDEGWRLIGGTNLDGGSGDQHLRYRRVR